MPSAFNLPKALFYGGLSEAAPPEEKHAHPFSVVFLQLSVANFYCPALFECFNLLEILEVRDLVNKNLQNLTS